MNFAIIDDKAEERKEMRLAIADFFQQRSNQYPEEYTLLEYDCAEKFLEKYYAGQFTAIIIDIYLGGMNGMELARRLLAKDPFCNLLFYTSSTEYLLEGYLVHAAGYILKPIREHIHLLDQTLSHLLNRMQMEQTSITVQLSHGECPILLSKIVYLECSLRTLYLHLSNDTLELQGKYSTYSDLLCKDPRFLECYRNVVVNMDYIDMPTQHDFVMKTGICLPISRRRKNEVMAKYTTYFIERRNV